MIKSSRGALKRIQTSQRVSDQALKSISVEIKASQVSIKEYPSWLREAGQKLKNS